MHFDPIRNETISMCFYCEMIDYSTGSVLTWTALPLFALAGVLMSAFMLVLFRQPSLRSYAHNLMMVMCLSDLLSIVGLLVWILHETSRCTSYRWLITILNLVGPPIHFLCLTAFTMSLMILCVACVCVTFETHSPTIKSTFESVRFQKHSVCAVLIVSSLMSLPNCLSFGNRACWDERHNHTSFEFAVTDFFYDNKHLLTARQLFMSYFGLLVMLTLMIGWVSSKYCCKVGATEPDSGVSRRSIIYVGAVVALDRTMESVFSPTLLLIFHTDGMDWYYLFEIAAAFLFSLAKFMIFYCTNQTFEQCAKQLIRDLDFTGALKRGSPNEGDEQAFMPYDTLQTEPDLDMDAVDLQPVHNPTTLPV